ncbi:MAG: glutathione S-transferase family protein [Pseudomonadota bacterium]
MMRLYHWTLDPASRFARLVLGEKGIEAELVDTPTWTSDRDTQGAIAKLAPGAQIPALVDNGADGRVVAIGPLAIVGHLEDACPTPRLAPHTRQDRAEANRLWEWIDARLTQVDQTLLADRVGQWVRRSQPDSQAMRTGAHALRGHMTFLNALAETRPYLAGRTMTIADLACAARMSAYDYFGDVDWDSAPDLKAWYGKIKSRPSFRALLNDRIEGARPAPNYGDLDF